MNRDLEAPLVGLLTRDTGLPAGAPVVLAVSGGMDSMALLHTTVDLVRRGCLTIQPVVAHLNHGLRSTESDADQALVEAVARNLAVPVDVQRVCLAPEPSVEARARRVRRRFLAEAAARHGASFVLLAHHADDQAETILDRFLAGAGPDGLRGMASRSLLERDPSGTVFVLRPWLNVPRAAIERHVQTCGLRYREDASNQDTTRRRNRIRHVILPFLKREANPDLPRTLMRIRALMADTSDVVRAVAEQALSRVQVVVPREIAWLFDCEPHELVCLDRRAFRGLDPALRAPVLRGAVRYLCPEAPPLPGQRRLEDWIRQVVALGNPGSPGRIRKGLHAALDARHLVMARHRLSFRPLPHPAILVISGALGWVRFPFRGLRLSRTEYAGSDHAETESRPPGSRVALRLDADRVGRQLVVRPGHADDRFCPPGSRTPVRLARYLKKRGVAAFQRRTVLVVADPDTPTIHGVLDHGGAAHAQVSKATRTTVTLVDCPVP